MGLFGFGKKKEKTSCCCAGSSEPVQEIKATCGCGSECGISDIEKARIIVLGACCSKSTETFENVKKAVEEMGLSEEVANIGDMAEIAKYGVMSTPAFVIDSKVVSMGKLIKVEEAKNLLKKAGFEEMAQCDCGNMCKVSDIEAKKAAEKIAEETEMSVKVLGSGCKKCNTLEEATKEALAKLNMDTHIDHVTDFAQIAAYGVMSTPALVVDGKVVSMGKVLKVDEVVSILEKVRG